MSYRGIGIAIDYIFNTQRLISNYLLDERLHLDELEDMHFSKIAYLNGLLISLDVNNYFITRLVRHQDSDHSDFYFKYSFFFYWLKGIFSNFLKYKNTVIKHYSKK